MTAEMGDMRERVSTWARYAVERIADHSTRAAQLQLSRKQSLMETSWESRFHRQVGPGQRAVDVGAHLGTISSLYAANFDEVWAIEPNPIHAAKLRRVLDPEVIVAPVACGSAPGWASLAVPRHYGRAVGSLGSLVETSDSGVADTDRYRVPVVRLDDLVDGPVDVLKVDAEGFEIEVLEGASRLLRNRPIVVVESEERHRHGAPQQVRRILESYDLEGLMVVGSAVAPAAQFDPSVHQAKPPPLTADDPGDYSEQFVFVPREDVAHWAERLAACLEPGRAP